MARLASTLLVLGLLAGTAAAFAVTEVLKLDEGPVTGPRVDNRIFSPVCAPEDGEPCPTAVTHLSLRFLEAGSGTVAIQDGDGEVVRTLAKRRFARGRATFEWDGRDEAGRVLPDGTYRPRVELDGERRTIVLPNTIRIDTTPPRVALAKLSRRTLSPNRDARGEFVYVHYRLSEQGHAELHAPGGVRIRALRPRPTGALRWFGRVQGSGLGPGTYRLELIARDVAGNRSTAVPFSVRIRYLELTPRRVHVAPGERFTVRVETDAVPFDWRLGEQSGRTRSRRLVVRAPSRPGTYRLVVSIKDSAARVRVVVGQPRS